MGGRIVLVVVLGYPFALSRRVHSPACSTPRYTEQAGAWEMVAAPINKDSKNETWFPLSMRTISDFFYKRGHCVCQ